MPAGPPARSTCVRSHARKFSAPYARRILHPVRSTRGRRWPKRSAGSCISHVVPRMARGNDSFRWKNRIHFNYFPDGQTTLVRIPFAWISDFFHRLARGRQIDPGVPGPRYLLDVAAQFCTLPTLLHRDGARDAASREIALRQHRHDTHAYVVRCRLRRAMKFLSRTDRSIVDIALDVGCACQSDFTMMFRKCTGTTPARFVCARWRTIRWRVALVVTAGRCVTFSLRAHHGARRRRGGESRLIEIATGARVWHLASTSYPG